MEPGEEARAVGVEARAGEAVAVEHREAAAWRDALASPPEAVGRGEKVLLAVAG